MFRPRSQHIPLLATTAVFLLLYIGTSLRHDGFFTWYQFSSLLKAEPWLGVAAMGVTFVILSGGIDLSVGAVVALTSIILAKLLVTWQLPVAVAFPLVLLLGATFGGAMGAIIHVFRLPAFLVTLAGMFLARGTALALENRLTIAGNATFHWLAKWKWVSLNFTIPTLVLLLVTALAVVVAKFTRFGRNVYALGGSESSAALMGLPVAQTKISVYALSGLCAALGGILYALSQRSGDATAVPGMELDAIAAVVIGGTLLSGGVGNPAGTLLGTLILGVITTIISFEGTLSTSWTKIAIGGLLLVFILLQRLLQVTPGRT